MKFREEAEASRANKEEYLGGLERLICARYDEARASRREYARDIFKSPEKYRFALRELLGWPLVGCEVCGLPKAESKLLAEEATHSVYRMQIEVLPELFMSGLYFEAKGDGAKPLVLVQHGGLGTPEAISGLYGSTTNYNSMLERVIATGTHAFAPQLLLWDKKYGVEYDRQDIDARLKQVGSSISAVEIFGLMRILDYFERQENVSSFGMVGLSYGGFYTLFTSALDTRIKSSISCAFFNTRDNYHWSDWTWFGFGEKFDDAEIAALVYPRRLCIEIGKSDPLFDVQSGVASYTRLSELCSEVGTEWVDLITFEGNHEFSKDDGPIKRLADDLFGE